MNAPKFGDGPTISRSSHPSAAFWVLQGGTVVLALGSMAMLVLYLDRGFDFTDEAYYLLWVDHPGSYELFQGTYFGFVLSPVFDLLGRNPAFFRYFGFALAALASCGFLAVAGFRSREGGPPNEGTFCRLALFGAAAALPITYYLDWLPTPSYNWLPLVAGFILMASLALLLDARYQGSAVLAAASGLLALYSKPTIAVGFSIIYLLVVGATLGFSGNTLKHLLTTGGWVLAGGVLTLIFIPPQLVGEHLDAYRSVYGAQPILSLTSGLRAPLPYYLIVAALVGASSSNRSLARLSAALCTLLFLLLAQRILMGGYGNAQWLVVPAASGALAALCLGLMPLNAAFSRRKMLVLMLSAMVLPWAMAFGTGSSVSMRTSFYVAVPAVTALAIAVISFGARDWRTIAVACFLTASAPAALMSAREEPYRLAADLTENRRPTRIAGGFLELDLTTAEFVDQIRREADSSGFEPGTAILDFSGDSPGITLVLEGRAPVTPWIINGYTFSDRLAEYVVENLSASDRRSAWIVHGEGPRPYDLPFLEELGFDLQNDYELAADLTHPIHNASVRLYAPVK